MERIGGGYKLTDDRCLKRINRYRGRLKASSAASSSFGFDLKMSTFFVASVCLLVAVITAQPYGDSNAQQGQQAGAYGGLENGEAVGIPNNGNQFAPQPQQGGQIPQGNINNGAASGEFGRVNSAENQQNAGPYGANQNRPAAQGYGPQTNVYGAPSGASGYGQQQQQFGYGQQANQVPVAGPYGRF